MVIDRKQRIRDYKDTPRPMGVFRIRNLRSERSFLGSSRDLPGILNRNRFQLRLGAHPCRALQADWKALGEDAFAFEVLDTLTAEPGREPADELSELLELWQERLRGEGAATY